MYRIGIIGSGTVGRAVENFFRKTDEVLVYDKYKEIGSLGRLLDCDLIYLCLPTPYIEGFGFDKSEIFETLKELDQLRYPYAIILKSTVEPGTTAEYQNIFPNLSIVYNPEFLSSKTADQDFANQNHIVIGYTKITHNGFMIFNLKYFPTAKITTCSSTEAECIKIFCNSFYAVKIQLMSEFYLACQKMNCSYETVKSGMIKNGWISEHHTQVPGNDGKISFGGGCFPKDIKALNQYMKRLCIPNEVLSACISEQEKIR